ncbi:hypothetical protein CYL18_06910 [Pradoshia eiseniae]|uniref:DUF2178 domain-containing protein n=1 Tax=Pradoshia eiseniae TaxID=2064768 RepID=A0A2S7N0X0_9BACI|nr:DUF2178 domain-containing protein [Pradoshia eiseniae]PQD95618.1 hypothetical protein CYL18_06910 [Pradoshia eiseniae]
MLAVKRVSVIGSLVVIIAIGGFGIYEWMTKEIITASTIFFVALGIGFFFHSLTWGEIDGENEGDKDEREKQITLISAKISYYVLLVMILIVLIASEGVKAMNEIENIPLVIVFALAWIIMPVTEFIVSKKYR